MSTQQVIRGTPSRLVDLEPPVRGLILDMDGVLWKDSVPIGDLGRVFHAIDDAGLKVVAVTNNATKTAQEYVGKLQAFGVKLESWQIVTSSDATADTLAAHFPDKERVYVVGEQGVVEALRARGFETIADAADDRSVVAVVASLDRTFTYERLQRAADHVRAGAAFYGTNPDPTFPTPAGLVPGAGSMVAAIAAASEKTPTVIGKPSPYMFELAAQRMKLPKEQILAIGDRLATDVAGGQAFGARTALVLSGVSTREQARAWQPQPDLIAENLAELLGL